ncbi:hypothetical protein CHU98_g10111 [Xylaria longipes]|nr:hypothetical protein CHU98_g10111 [Xylaria longipes]
MAKVIPNASPTTFVEGLTVLSDPENAEADVVFVHGLQGDPYLTWTCDVKTHREKPQMNQRQRPQHTPQFLRCFFCSLGVEDDDDSHAQPVSASHETEQQQLTLAVVVIFVVHSLGGIVVKETLRRSEASEEDELKDIMRSTKGIIFMGTPHRGSPGLASLGEAVRRVASVIGRVDSNSTLLRSLGTDSPELELGRESFLVLWRTYDFRVKTFQEAHGISGVNVGPANEKLYYNLSTSQRCTGVLLEALRSAKYALEPTYFIPQVQWLLANGADVNVRNQLGRTALHIAATIDVDSDFVREILLYDPDVNAQDNNGETPLHLTGYWTLRPNDIAELLIAHGAGVRIVDNKGDNVLSYLLRCRTSLLNKSLLLAMSQVLVKAGCPLNSKDRQGQTVLHHLVSRMSDFGAARRDGPLAALYVYLYEAGADPMIEDDAGKTPKDILQEQGVDVDAAGALVLGLDFEHAVEACNRIPARPQARTSRVAFSLRVLSAALTMQSRWDLNRGNRKVIIRVNSQSGKGGAAQIILRNSSLIFLVGYESPPVRWYRSEQTSFKELLSAETTDLFEQTYSTSSAPPAPGETHGTTNIRRVFEGIVAIDGKKYRLQGRGNGPISSLANALKGVGINLDVMDYKEHSINSASTGARLQVKATAYIWCTAASIVKVETKREHHKTPIVANAA